MFSVRPYKSCDLKEIANWVTSEEEFYCWSLGDFGDYNNVFNCLDTFIKGEENNTSVLHFVATNQTGVLGYATLERTDKNAAIKHVILSPSARNRGIGVKFVKYLARYVFNILKAETIDILFCAPKDCEYKKICIQGFKIDFFEGQTRFFGGKEYTDIRTAIVVASTEIDKADVQEADYAVKEIIDSNGFRYAYQPIVDAKTGEIYGYEALMRAEYDGNISPLTVLDYARKNNRLNDIEKATFFNVLKDLSQKRELFGDRYVFINSLPGYLLKDDDFEELEAKYPDILKQVVVEITEATELADHELDIVLKRSKRSGFGVAIDDYGTGYSNTSNLLRYVPNCVKIDRLLITNIHQDAKKQHFVNSLVSFAHDNGFMVLAEGVETAAECRYVVQAGVDLVQGFYTARPSFDVLDEINTEIRNEILSANVRDQSLSDRKTYHVQESDYRIPVMRLALEQYTGIIVSTPKIQLIGNSNYAASMNVKIKDDTKCHMTIRDVMLESFQELPCIELGENVELTLTILGNCNFRKVGICVPPTSKLILEGTGNLVINAKGIRSYGIGSGWESEFGTIILSNKGRLNINVEAEYAIAIGGGIAKTEESIKVVSGEIDIDLASANSIGVGFVRGNSKISISGSKIGISMNSENGTAVGVLEQKGILDISTSTIKITGAGNSVTGIGSPEAYGADMNIAESTIDVSMNGSKVHLLGVDGGQVNVNCRESVINLKGEGSEITGVGSRSGEGHIYAKDTVMNVTIRSGMYVVLGANEENVKFEGGTQNFVANR